MVKPTQSEVPESGPLAPRGGGPDSEQLQIPIPPADGMSLGEWMETLPKDTQYRTCSMAVR
jgi:hypothetical protein